MGYTHYMKGVNLTEELLENTKNIVKIAEKKGIHLTSDEGKKPPVLNENLIVINGYRDEACETFLVMSENRLKSESEEWASVLVKQGSEKTMEDGIKYAYDTLVSINSFCKTWRKPYDAVVTAVLTDCILNDNGQISSDGSYSEWEDGISLYEEAVKKLDDTDRAKLKKALNAHISRKEVKQTVQEVGGSCKFNKKSVKIFIPYGEGLSYDFSIRYDFAGNDIDNVHSDFCLEKTVDKFLENSKLTYDTDNIVEVKKHRLDVYDGLKFRLECVWKRLVNFDDII